MDWGSDTAAFRAFSNIRTLLFSVFLHLLVLSTPFSGGWAGIRGFELAVIVRRTLSYLVLWVELCPPPKDVGVLCLAPVNVLIRE